MGNDFITTINSSNQQLANEKAQQNLSKSDSQTNKKLSKTKKFHTKSSYCGEDEIDQLPKNSSSKRRIINLNDHPKSSSKVVAHTTKVKSASWKRSERAIVPLNSLNANKSRKALRKKSPNWLNFSNSKTKKQDSNSAINGSEPTSACRPGMLYSDVLFGAGCSNLVKIKNTMPRNYNNTSLNVKKKLTKALFKCSGNQNNPSSDESEIDGKKNLFPALRKIKNKIYSPSPKTNDNHSKQAVTTTEEKISSNELSSGFKNSPTKNEVYEDADVVILSDLNDLSLVDNNVSYGNYLEQQLQHLNGENKTTHALASSSKANNTFLYSSISNIPKWNFINIETGDGAFPKFLCQFDDENYLKAEKIALLGLKLALGNHSPHIK